MWGVSGTGAVVLDKADGNCWSWAARVLPHCMRISQHRGGYGSRWHDNWAAWQTLSRKISAGEVTGG